MRQSTGEDVAAISILFVMRDPLPPTRPDVRALFGTFLSKMGVRSDLVGPTTRNADAATLDWPAGRMVSTGYAGGMLGEALKGLRDLKAFRSMPLAQDIVQVRDRTCSALAGWALARVLRKPFVFWMSFPIVEGYEARAAEVGLRLGAVTWLANHVRAWLARVVYYGFIARQADHLFVQSDAMLDWMQGQGIPRERMTAVPMGVDIAVFSRMNLEPADDACLSGRRVIVYLGTLTRARQPDFMLDVVREVRRVFPEVLLVLAGDAPAADEQAWLREQIVAKGVEDHVWLTGWLPQDKALRLVCRAEVGLSPIPRGVLYDVSSPTKALEYLALGVPCVGNDIPDQAYVLEKSGAGLCVPMTVEAFSGAVAELLADPERARLLGGRGPGFIETERTYAQIAGHVAEAYRRLLGRVKP